jgi:hypothetical protein
MVNPEACCKSRPVGDTRFPVARKLAIFEPISKLMRERTLLIYRSENLGHPYAIIKIYG